ncbi:hypothetical protein BN946_scf184836.g57 [Trametes cinnabarina]|uniref:Uncharacterized protein n=1 Tax=Pycnoporus cinnabarinus TaxID=5643 RepID=A0A060SC60_PYCCI|nr:hypothetical protein BN946_scf184836.g57 [Trametes cinnabarina]
MTAHPERAATYDQLTLTYSSEVPGRGPPPAPLALVIEMIMTLCERLPEVRALKLDSFEFDEPALYALLTVAGRIHTLEYLYLDTLELPHQSPPWPHASVESWSASEGGSSRWALRKLLLNSGMIPTAELQSLVSFLEQSRESIPLESLELCTSLLQYSPDIVDNRPGAPHSLGLRHYGNTVNDISRKGKMNARKEDLLLPMLEPFVKAGVQVDIAID